MAAAISKSVLSLCVSIILFGSTGISASQQDTQLRKALPDAQLSITLGAKLNTSKTSTGINQDGNNGLADGSGAAYSFAREAGVWQPLAYIKASNTGEGDKFGVAVAVSASTLLIGALNEDSNTTEINGDEENDLAPLSGAAYVFSVDNIGQIFIDSFESN